MLPVARGKTAHWPDHYRYCPNGATGTQGKISRFNKGIPVAMKRGYRYGQKNHSLEFSTGSDETVLPVATTNFSETPGQQQWNPNHFIKSSLISIKSTLNIFNFN